jgi:hypothetical protein
MMLFFFIWDSVFKKYHYIDGDGFFFFCVEFFRGYLLSGEICEVPLAMVGFTVGASKFRAFSDVFVSFLHFSFLFCILALHLLLFGFLYAGLWEFGPLAWFLFF